MSNVPDRVYLQWTGRGTWPQRLNRWAWWTRVICRRSYISNSGPRKSNRRPWFLLCSNTSWNDTGPSSLCIRLAPPDDRLRLLTAMHFWDIFARLLSTERRSNWNRLGDEDLTGDSICQRHVIWRRYDYRDVTVQCTVSTVHSVQRLEFLTSDIMYRA